MHRLQPCQIFEMVGERVIVVLLSGVRLGYLPVVIAAASRAPAKKSGAWRADLSGRTDNGDRGPKLASPVSFGGVELTGKGATRRRVDRGGAQGDLGV